MTGLVGDYVVLPIVVRNITDQFTQFYASVYALMRIQIRISNHIEPLLRSDNLVTGSSVTRSNVLIFGSSNPNADLKNNARSAIDVDTGFIRVLLGSTSIVGRAFLFVLGTGVSWFVQSVYGLELQRVAVLRRSIHHRLYHVSLHQFG